MPAWEKKVMEKLFQNPMPPQFSQPQSRQQLYCPEIPQILRGKTQKHVWIHLASEPSDKSRKKSLVWL